MSIYQRISRGTVNEDGSVFWRYARASGKVYECWVSADKYRTLKEEERIRSYRKNHKDRYGLNSDDVESMKSEHDFCVMCGQEYNMIQIPVVDHDHTTGKVRGIICVKCNTMLGFAKDNLGTLSNAISYLSG
jgi:hypothetical protein